MRIGLLTMATLAGSASMIGVQAANTATGSLWHVTDAVAHSATPANVPATTPDVTFDVNSPFDFNGTDFSVLTTLVGDATNIALGTIHRVGANEGNFTGSIPFAFQLAFSLPLGAGGGTDFYTAQIIGQAQGGGGAASMDFDNTIQHVSFVNALGSGSFDFLIHDIAGLGKNDTITLFGDISNATLGGVNPTVDTPVPEPASLLLVGGGLMAVTARVRRKKA